MSQLNFEGFPPVPEKPETAKPASPPAEPSWYEGRTLSHSSISLYRTCPQRWKFRYIDKIPEKPHAALSFGKSVHTGLEFLFSAPGGAKPTVDALLEHYQNNWISEGYDSSAQEKWYYQEGARILRGFYAKHGGDGGKVEHIEYRFTIQIDGVPVTGFIDRVDRTPSGGIAIIDYKTGKAFDKSRVRKDPQLTLYQIACRELLGRPVETVTLYHLNSLTPLTVPAHSSELEKSLRENVVQAARGITDGKFDPRPDERGHCQWCDYVQICPAFTGKKPNIKGAGVTREAAAEAADRYGRLLERLGDLEREKAALEETITTFMKQNGAPSVEGRFFTAAIGADDASPGSLSVTPREEAK